MPHPFKCLLSLLVLGLVGAPLTAQAWLFSADVLVRKVGVARRNLQNAETKLSSLEVRGTLRLIGKEAGSAAGLLGMTFDPAAPEIFLPATASYKIPGRCRIEAQLKPEGPRLASSNNGGVRAIDMGGKRLAVFEMFADIACPLLDGHGGYDGPMSLVKASGVKRSIVTLGRAEGQNIAYVVGASPAQTDVSSLWVGKETFQPLRFVDHRPSSQKELRFIDYDAAQIGRWHPRRIEFFQEGRLIGTFTIDRAVPNPKLNDAIF